MHKKVFLRVCFLLLIIITFAVIFHFSSEVGEKSTSTSKIAIKKMIRTFPNTQNSDNIQETKQIEGLQPIVRKIAHFSIYSLLGIWLMCFIWTYKITIQRKLFFTTGIGMLYAISDEIHQAFIPGRTPSALDVVIDTCGVILGSLIVIISIHFWVRIRNKRNQKKETPDIT